MEFYCTCNGSDFVQSDYFVHGSSGKTKMKTGLDGTKCTNNSFE